MNDYPLEQVKLGREIALIRASGLFDAAWYLKQYSDVAKLQVDPAWHYCYCGWKEGRKPSLKFDGKLYLEGNIDVMQAAINPLVHWVRFGEKQPWRFKKMQSLMAKKTSEAQVVSVEADKKIFHVTGFDIGCQYLYYTIQIESARGVETRVPFKLYFNKPVKIFRSSIIYMFETIFNAPQNVRMHGCYDLKIDLSPDLDVEKVRQQYTRVLLADGTGLDSHAIRLLGKESKSLRFVTIQDLKSVELENISRAEYDTEDSVIMSGEGFLKNRKVGDILLDFSHDGNRLYLLMLLLDHFEAKKVLTADCEKIAIKSYYGNTTDIYTCNFLYGDFGTLAVNAVLDKANFINRIMDCGHFPPFKNLRKYLVAKFLEKRLKVEIFSPKEEDLFFERNEIDIAGKINICDVLLGYKRLQQTVGGLLLLDSYVISLKAINRVALKKRLVHNRDQQVAFDKMCDLVDAEYKASKQRLKGIRLFDLAKLQCTFNGDDLYDIIREKLNHMPTLLIG